MDDNSYIELSPKYGMNPTLATCFWCGEETGEIALPGRIRSDDCDDIEAPRHSVIDYVPCDKCAEKFALGVTCMEVRQTPEPPGQPEIQSGIYPTGRFMVLTEDGIVKLLHDRVEKDEIDAIIEHGSVFFDTETFSQVMNIVEGQKDSK